MLKKQNVAKLLLILFILTFALGTMTGCGMISADDNSPYVKKAQTQKQVFGLYTGQGVAIFDAELVESSFTFHPVIDFGAKDVSVSEISAYGSSIPLLHIIAHFVVGALGGDIECYAKGCNAGSAIIDLSPGTMVSEGLALGQTITGAFGSLAGVATAILVAIWAMNFIQLVVQERFTMESALKGFCKLILGVLVVQNATNIVSAFMGILGSGAGGGNFTNFGSELSAFIKHDALAVGFAFNVPIAKFGFGFVFWIDLVTPLLGIALGFLPLSAQVKCAAQILSAMIITGAEMSLRLAAAPLMFALTSDTGWGQTQISYIKGSMACAAHPAIVMALIGGIGSFASGIAAGGILGSMIATVLAYNILAGFIGEAKQIGHNVFMH